MPTPDVSSTHARKLACLSMATADLGRIRTHLRDFPELADDVMVLGMIERGVQALYERTFAAIIELANDGRD